jgi:hypothetical protein
MSRVVFEPMIPAFERAETIYTLDRVATVIGRMRSTTIFHLYNCHQQYQVIFARFLNQRKC